jgi:hypothetical protein
MPLRRISASTALSHDITNLDLPNLTRGNRLNILLNIRALAYLDQAPAVFTEAEAIPALVRELQAELKQIAHVESGGHEELQVLFCTLNVLTTTRRKITVEIFWILHQLQSAKFIGALYHYVSTIFQISSNNLTSELWEPVIECMELIGNMCLFPSIASELMDYKQSLPLFVKLLSHPRAEIRDYSAALFINLTLCPSRQNNLLLVESLLASIVSLVNTQPKSWGIQDTVSPSSDHETLASISMRAASIVTNLLAQSNSFSTLFSGLFQGATALSDQKLQLLQEVLQPIFCEPPTASSELLARSNALVALGASHGLLGLLRIGGPLAEFAAPRAIEALGRMISYTRTEAVSQVVLGDGVPVVVASLLRSIDSRPAVTSSLLRLLGLMVSVAPALVCLAIPKASLARLQQLCDRSAHTTRGQRSALLSADQLQMAECILQAAAEVQKMVCDGGAVTRAGGSVLLGDDSEPVYGVRAPVEDFKVNLDPSNQCGNCGKIASKKCSRCKTSVYCGMECIRKHWPIHKLKCMALS